MVFQDGPVELFVFGLLCFLLFYPRPCASDMTQTVFVSQRYKATSN